jgi:hypothetical protein
MKIEGSGSAPDPDQDPLVRGMDPRIRIHTKMSWIRITAWLPSTKSCRLNVQHVTAPLLNFPHFEDLARPSLTPPQQTRGSPAQRNEKKETKVEVVIKYL